MTHTSLRPPKKPTGRKGPAKEKERPLNDLCPNPRFGGRWWSSLPFLWVVGGEPRRARATQGSRDRRPPKTGSRFLPLNKRLQEFMITNLWLVVFLSLVCLSLDNISFSLRETVAHERWTPGVHTRTRLPPSEAGLSS